MFHHATPRPEQLTRTILCTYVPQGELPSRHVIGSVADEREQSLNGTDRGSMYHWPDHTGLLGDIRSFINGASSLVARMSSPLHARHRRGQPCQL
jgi:hypothetical protein